MLRGREDECLVTLANLRSLPPDHPAVQTEFLALQAERLVEREAAKERYGYNDVNFRVSLLEYKRLLTTKSLLYRLLVGAGAQALQQWTGINAIIYVRGFPWFILTRSMPLRSSRVWECRKEPWACSRQVCSSFVPSFRNALTLVPFSSVSSFSAIFRFPLLLFVSLRHSSSAFFVANTGVVGIVNFVFTIPAVLWVDSVGRKPLLIYVSRLLRLELTLRENL